MQGACKFGFYEFFKHTYGNLVGDESALKYRTYLYLASSASSEFIADVALSPMEALKVRIQTSNGNFTRDTINGFRNMSKEGFSVFYAGLMPLWFRQVPYTMMKFAAFEKTVEHIYSTILKRSKNEYNKVQQLGVSFVAGYWAGIFCAVVSHPADTLVSKLNSLSQSKHTPRKPIFTILRELGFLGVWRGLGTRIFMIGTLTALQWFIYDTFKVYAGLPTTGSVPLNSENSKNKKL